MRKALFISAGWVVLATGTMILFVPLPLPFPVGPVLVLVGATVLTTHSKPFRRVVQVARHRYGWLDRSVEYFGRRSPRSVRAMVARTQPMAVGRYRRLHANGQGGTHHPCGAAE